ncbi:hypothetical protein CC1G_09293 [Coprinopsis cinerea okayama7|uniref:H-type lectin domain-containing protein n=1 Tax=Coprinopsis cinerea (strain Okayama-7 / 130 / ATCC MYA-4618 / FGSC 9003) TaxID=240176 RepID=A8N872_COPC7|nr:hypothetical protein CC1G_09293 [Coprinopsis cinerea okayama7\|eukprot:XP_001831028.2 hypothetical protein CC1G_09293 [Coprinopsis cinerea okayama7\
MARSSSIGGNSGISNQDATSKTVNYLLLEHKVLHDTPFPVEVSQTQYDQKAHHLRPVFAQALKDEFGLQVDLQHLRLWKPKIPLTVDAPLGEGWFVKSVESFHQSFEIIPFVDTLRSRLRSTIDNHDLIHIIVTISDIYNEGRRTLPVVPGPVSASKLLHPAIEAGYFTVNKGRDWKSVQKPERHSRDIKTSPQTTLPIILIGFSMIDVTATDSGTAKALCYGDNFEPERFRVHLDTWVQTKLYKAEVGWLRATMTPLLQGGSVDANHYCKPEDAINDLSKRIDFLYPFEAPPIVFVSLSGFSIGEKHWDIRVSSSNVDSRGFTVNIGRTRQWKSLSNTHVHWLAFPEHGLPGQQLCVGEFKASGLNPSKRSQTGTVNFSREFKNGPPSLFFSINNIDAEAPETLRVHAKVSNITGRGMDWKIEQWSNTRIHNVSVSYLAIED